MGNFARGEAGFFIFMTTFTKQAKTPEQLIELLKLRGLTIADTTRTKRYIQSIGYYRLSAYFIPFQEYKDTFRRGVTFDHILALYIFDRKLRNHVMDAMERVEVAVRSVLSNTLCTAHGPHWYLDRQIFSESFRYQEFKNNIAFHTGRNDNRNRNLSCRHYYDVYTEPALPPSWMIIEVLPMGTWSLVYEYLRRGKLRQKISKFFAFSTNDFTGWLHALTLIRNNCAHHNRFWNHTFPPKAKNIAKYTYAGIPLNTPYTNLAMIHAFLCSFTRNPSWSNGLYTLLKTCPVDTHRHMEFPENWEHIPFWRIS
ncbi:MAG: Abi family protein [Candidatus Electrothrix sp. AUS4]|nr:Abi family protein [Candidatus Electrothrix sp. AUS4]